MIENIKHIIGTCGESHLNIYTLILITIAFGLISKLTRYKN